MSRKAVPLVSVSLVELAKGANISWQLAVWDRMTVAVATLCFICI